MHFTHIHTYIYTGKGSWPAFWMMGNVNVYGGWPWNGEIDIMECLNNAPTHYGTIHFGQSGRFNIRFI